MSKSYSKYSKKLLFTTFNCAKSQLIPLQDMQNIRNDELIMALTGLAGGILNNGSTCGVVIGGAISSAMIRDKELSGQWTLENEIQLLDEIKINISWFENRFGTSLCREREELNYQRITVLGLLNPQKAKGCVARADKSMDYFVEKYDSASETIKVFENTRKNHNAGEQRNRFSSELCTKSLGSEQSKSCEHCAQKILREIREETGIGNEELERISVALDGGMGLSGGGCGALSGALMALGLKYALDPKNTEPNKLKNIYKAMDSEFFKKARILVNNFIKEFEYLECKRITGKNFENWDEFSKFRNSSSCDKLNEFLVKETLEIIRGDFK